MTGRKHSYNAKTVPDSAMVMAYLGGLHFGWPKMTGKIYSEVGPRRYHVYPDEFQVFHVMSSLGATILGIGYLLPLGYLLWSLKNVNLVR